MRVACIGEAMVELAMVGSSAQVGVAGDTLNSAIYLKRQAPDISVDYITRVGDDPFSDHIRDFIASHDIGVSTVGVLPGGSPGLYAITTTDDGERSFTYWRDQAAAKTLFDDGDFSALANYDLIYVSGISLAILPDAVRGALLDALTSQNVPFAFDSNFRPKLWSADQAQKAMAGYWANAAFCLPSIDDEMLISGEDETTIAQRFLALQGSGGIKRGAAGPMCLDTGDVFDFGAVSKVVDTTAAGDSFNGAYLAERLKGASQEAALKAGHDLAAHVIQQRGAIAPPLPR